MPSMRFWIPLFVSACTLQSGLNAPDFAGSSFAAPGAAGAPAPSAPTEAVAPKGPDGVPCDAAHDHCLPPGTWVALDLDRVARDGNHSASLCFEQGGVWFEHGTGLCPSTTIARTRPARAADLVPGARVVVFRAGASDGDQLPDRASDALSRWSVAVVESFDEASGALVDKGGVGRLVGTRAIVETRMIVQPAAAAPREPAAWQAGRETEPAWSNEGDQPAELPGPRVEHGPALCDAAHGHCLHGNTWFVRNRDDASATEPAVCFRAKQRLWSWERGTSECTVGTAYRTAPATAKQLARGAIALVFTEDFALPATAARARSSSGWRIGKVAKVDAAAGAMWLDGSDTAYPIALARVAVETIEWKPR